MLLCMHENISCSVLQRVAVCCSVLQCVAVCCSVLQPRYAIMYTVAVCCSVLQCVAVSVCYYVYMNLTAHTFIESIRESSQISMRHAAYQ